MKLVNAVAIRNQEINQTVTPLNFAYLFENSMDSVLVIDEFGFVKYLNKSYEEMFKTSRFTEVGKGVKDIGVDGLILESLKKKEASRGYITLSNNKAIEITTSPMYDSKLFAGLICNYRIHQNRIEKNTRLS